MISRNENKAAWAARMKTNDLYQGLTRLNVVARKLAQGNLPCSVLVWGPPGIGKTHAVVEQLQECRRGYIEIKGGTTLGMIAKLVEAVESKLIAVIDDNDRVWREEDALNVLKVATAPKGRRLFSYWTAKSKLDVDFAGLRTVILTNVDMADPSKFSARYTQHVDAIRSRCLPVSLRATKSALWEYSVHLAINGGLLRHVSLAEANDALAFFTAHMHKLPDLSPRRLEFIADLRRSNPGDWRTLASAMFVKTYNDSGAPPIIPQIVPARAPLSSVAA